MSDTEDFTAALRAEEDQAHAALLHLANRLGIYKRYLILAGFDLEQSWYLVSEYYDVLLAHQFAIVPLPDGDD